MLYCEWNRSVEQKVWNESPLLGFWARVRGYVYMPTQHGKRSMCLSIWSATQICLTLHKCTHLRWNADQSFLRSYLTGILWNIVYTYYLELPSLLGRSQCFISATSGRVSGIRRSIKFAKSGQNLHGLCREESKGCNAQPLSQQGWTVDISNGQSLVLGRDCVRWEVLNWLRDCNSEGLIEVNSMMPGALLSLGGCRGSSVTSLTGSRWASLH